MIRLGQIGCGVIGRKHLEAATRLPNAIVAAIADLDPVRLEATSKEFGIGKATADVREILGDPDIDGIVVALPTAVRTPIALDVLAHGKHLLVEKPVAMNAGEVRALIEARGKKIAGCCSCRFRFLEIADTVQSALNSGRVGRLRTVRIRALSKPPLTRPENPPVWRLSKRLNGGGILVNWGSYDLDFVLGTLGWAVQPLAATGQTFPVPDLYRDWIAPGSDAETHVIAQVRCNNDVVIDYERAELHPGQGELSWSFSGDRGTLSVVFDSTEVQATLVTADSHGSLSAVTLGKAPLDHEHMHAGPVTDFVRAIETGNEVKTPLGKALIIAQITDAIYASAANGSRGTPIESDQPL